MPDDLKDLGTIPLERFTVNWRESAKFDYDPAGRRVIGFDGTAKQIVDVSVQKPQILEFAATLSGKEQEKAMLDRFVASKGRHGRFWMLLPHNLFELTIQQAIGATSLEVKRNEFEFRGFERFYILMKKGDLITRAMTDYVVDEANETADIFFATGTDRLLSPEDISLFSLALLVRLDNDSLNLKHSTAHVSEVTLRVIELVQEYSLI